LSLIPPPPSPTLLPYTTLFRSLHALATNDDGRRRVVIAAIIAIETVELCTVEFQQIDRGRDEVVWPLAVFAHVIVVSHFQLPRLDRKSTRLNSSHVSISYAVFC